MMQREMTDSEVREVVERTEAFIEQIGVAVSEAIGAVDPHSPCADASRRSPVSQGPCARSIMR